MRDLETVRTFRIPAITDALSGRTAIEYQGASLPIEGGAVTVSVECDEYLLFSSCLEIDRRMPTDFEADSALIIKDAKRFLAATRQAAEDVLGPIEFQHGAVEYFDPFRPAIQPSFKQRDVRLEFTKHFSYSYQNEHRILVRPIGGEIPKEPVYLTLGSLQDYAEIIVA